MPTKKKAASGKKSVDKTAVKSSQRKSASAKKSVRKKSPPEKDPKGGLTAEGRKAFAKKEGSHLRPGVKGPADTPEKMRRKGSFLRRHFAHPRGPVERDGKPTRLALSAHAWGEPVPKTTAAVKKLAAKGTALLEKYQRTKAKPAKRSAKPNGRCWRERREPVRSSAVAVYNQAACERLCSRRDSPGLSAIHARSGCSCFLEA